MRLADKLGIDRSSACETYYACQLAHAGCTTEAHVAAEIFGGSMTSNLNPVMYGTGLDPLEAEAIDRALAAMGSFADLASPSLRPFRRRRDARRPGSRGVRHRCAGCHGGPPGGSCPRHRPGGDPPGDLAEAGVAHGRRMGAGAPASLPRGARPITLAVPHGAVPDRGEPITSASTDPATTAGPPGRSSRFRRGCWRRPTPTTR